MCNAQSGTLRGRLIAQLRFRSSQKLILAPVMTMLNPGCRPTCRWAKPVLRRGRWLRPQRSVRVMQCNSPSAMRPGVQNARCEPRSSGTSFAK